MSEPLIEKNPIILEFMRKMKPVPYSRMLLRADVFMEAQAYNKALIECAEIVQKAPTIGPETERREKDGNQVNICKERDIVRELFAEVGEADILLKAERFMKLPPVAGILAVEDHRIKPDEMHLFVVLSDSEPRRLVLDADFGWLWYNSEGPEE